MRTPRATTTPLRRNDHGFSFVQLIVTMVISGILLGTVGFTVFSYINRARDTVLSSNIRTAAESVQNTLALNPGLRGTPADGVPTDAFINALTASAPFVWIAASSAGYTAGEAGWELPGTAADPDVMHIQMIRKATPTARGTTNAASSAGGATAGDTAPAVRWLVADGDAVRIQARNEDGSWACALIILRPDWSDDLHTGSTGDIDADDIAQVEGNLRGVWYDSGANIVNGGRHNCSPTSIAAAAFGGTAAWTTGTTGIASAAANTLFGNEAAGDDNSDTTRDPLPVSASTWNIPGDTSATPAELARVLERSVPSFG